MRQDHLCDLPYLPVADVEEAVERHYVTVAIPADLRARITEGVDSALAANSSTADGLRERIREQLTKLDAQEDQYIDLIGDPD